MGADRIARIAFAHTTLRSSARVTLSMLCKRPAAGGSIVAADGRAVDTPTHRVRVRHALLRTRPGGPARGSVRRGQPIAVRATNAGGTWRRVVTDRGERGWLPTGVLSRSQP